MKLADTPLRRKLTGIILLTCSSVLLLLCSSYIAFEFYNSRNILKKDITTLSLVIASNSAAALAFNSPADGTEILSALRADENVVLAAIYDKAGKLFAVYPAGIDTKQLPSNLRKGNGRFEASYYEITTPIQQDGTALGTLYLKSDLQTLYMHLQWNTLLAVVLIIISLGLAYILSFFLHRSVIGPVLTLNATARAISEDGDYSVRVKKWGNDELGRFTDSFNEMLAHIETQTRELSTAKDENAKLAAIVASSDDAIIGKNLDGIITSWNIGAERIFGYTASEMVGQSVLKLIPPNLHKEEARIIAELQAGHHIGLLETQRLTKDQRLLDVSLTISPVKNTEGFITGASKIARDVSRQKQIERLIVKNEEQLRLATLAAELGTFDIDLPKERVEWDARCRELIGLLSHHPVRYPTLLHSIHEDDREQVLAAVRRSFDLNLSGGNYDLECRVLGIDIKKTRWIKIKGIVFFNVLGKPIRIIGTMLDITDKKQEDLKKNEFIAIVSHELKTPLTSIKAYIQILIGKEAEREANEFSLNVLRRTELQVNKMGAMIQDFLSLARLEEGKLQITKQVFDFALLLEEVKADVGLLSSTHTIALKRCNTAMVNADKEKLNQVMINLLSNAIKYSERDSRIVFGCELMDDKLRVYVKDEGVGISAEDQKKLFGRFYRVNNEKAKNVSGFGIGLYIVSEILKNHDSKIELISEPGRGSTFSFYLDIVK